jgi:hypothetical protein
MSIRNFNLRRGQVKKEGEDWFNFSCLYTTQIIVLKILLFSLFDPHQLSGQKTILRYKNIGRVFAPLTTPQVTPVVVWYFDRAAC